MTTELPFLVVHGAVVWKVLLAALVVASLALALAWRRYAARQRALRAVGQLLRSLNPAGAGPVVLRGRLRGGTATSLTQRGHAADHRTDALWLEHDGQRIALDGPVRVDHGTRAWASWFAPPRPAPATLVASARRARATLVHAVGDDDEVVVKGTLAPGAQPAQGYREVPWVFVADAAPIRVVAVHPAARPRPLGPAWLAILALVFAAGWTGVLHGVGTRALARADETRTAHVTQLDGWDGFAIAAALPSTRARALDALSEHLHYHAERTEPMIQLQLALLEVRGECPLPLLVKLARFEAALAAARRCGTPRDVAVQLAYLGRFDEAVGLVSLQTDPHLATQVAIGAGRWTDAARGAEAWADAAEQQPHDRDAGEHPYHAAATTARCAAALFRAYAGEASPFAHVEGKARTLDCAVLEALALPDEQQAEVLATLSYGDALSLEARADALRMAAGGPMKYRRGWPVTTFHDSLFWGPFSRVDLETLWLAPIALASYTGDDPRTLAALRLGVAALAAFRGHLPTAGQIEEFAAAETAARLPPDGLRLAFDLLDPAKPLVPPSSYAEVHPGLAPRARLRWGTADKNLERGAPYNSRCADQLDQAFRAAMAGDGGPLATVFRRCTIYWLEVPDLLLGVLPRVTTHRAELAAVLRLYRDDFSSALLRSTPFHVFGIFTQYRDVARFVGDTAEADAWEQILERHATVLADRKRVTAFMIWNH